MTRSASALAALRTAADRPDPPAVLVLRGAGLALWAVLAALVGYGAVDGVAALAARLFGLGMEASVVTGFGLCGLAAGWTGWLVTGGRRGP